MKKTNTDAPFSLLMGKIGDLVFANVLWLVCCIPVVTAGASTLGLFTVVNKLAAREDYTVRTDFFKAFKRDFKQSTVLWLVVLLGGLAGFRGLQIATAQDTASNGVLAAASFLLLLVVGCCGSWAFALLARFSYPKALSALADGGRMTLANLLPSVGILAFLAWLPLLAGPAAAGAFRQRHGGQPHPGSGARICRRHRGGGVCIRPCRSSCRQTPAARPAHVP